MLAVGTSREISLPLASCRVHREMYDRLGRIHECPFKLVHGIGKTMYVNSCIHSFFLIGKLFHIKCSKCT